MSPTPLRSPIASGSCLVLAASCGVALAGCAGGSGAGTRAIAVGDFSSSIEALAEQGVTLPPFSADTRDAVRTDDPAEDTPAGPASEAPEVAGRSDANVSREGPGADRTPALATGESWPVDELIGQINGRPIFADAFFQPISDELIAHAAKPDRVVGRELFTRTVRAAFKGQVDSELVVAEAESQLSPEQQEGIFAWLRGIQEETIAERGGSRAAAEASLRAEGTQSLDDYLQETREVALASRLLAQKIDPRAIVSWREVLQAYERDRKIYNPPEQIRIGRIRFDATTDADKIERVKQLVAEGRNFSELVTEFGVADGGLWQSSDLPAEGIEGLPLSDAVKTRIKDLAPGAVSEPLEQRDFTSWFAVLAIERPKSRSVYDRDLQLTITEQLRSIRRTIERQRYLNSLRSRWVTDDIVEMEKRLVDFALARYWR
jgi:hypothetical protein